MIWPKMMKKRWFLCDFRKRNCWIIFLRHLQTFTDCDARESGGMILNPWRLLEEELMGKSGWCRKRILAEFMRWRLLKRGMRSINSKSRMSERKEIFWLRLSAHGLLRCTFRSRIRCIYIWSKNIFLEVSFLKFLLFTILFILYTFLARNQIKCTSVFVRNIDFQQFRLLPLIFKNCSHVGWFSNVSDFFYKKHGWFFRWDRKLFP